MLTAFLIQLFIRIYNLMSDLGFLITIIIRINLALNMIFLKILLTQFYYILGMKQALPNKT